MQMLPLTCAVSPNSLDWATEKDWPQWRRTITQLYMRDGKPLKVVMAIMLQNHEFKASYDFSVAETIFTDTVERQKMYKSRFELWGLRKNKKRSEKYSPNSVPAKHRSSTGCFSTMRSFNDEAHHRPSRMYTTIDVHSTTPDTSATPTDASASLEEDTPNSGEALHSRNYEHLSSTFVNLVEKLLCTIRTYIIDSVETGAWAFYEGNFVAHRASENHQSEVASNNFRGKTESADVYTLVRHARQLFNGRDNDQGGLFLRQAFSYVGSILMKEDPFTVWELLNTVSYLHEVGWTEVLRAFMTHVMNMSAVTYTQAHPTYRIFRVLDGAVSSELLYIISQLRHCAAEEVEKITEPTAVCSIKLRLGWIRSLCLIECPESVGYAFEAVLKISQVQFGKMGLQSLLALNRIGSYLHERKLYSAAEATGYELVSCANDPSLSVTARSFRGRGLSLIGRAQMAQGKCHDARRTLSDLLDFDLMHYGQLDSLTVSSMLRLESCLEACGEHFEAQKIRASKQRLVMQIQKDLLL